MSGSAISIRGVEKSFGGRTAVAGLDLEIPRGSLCGVLGPNGAGKSTTIRMVLSILYPDRGTIEVLGGSALAMKERIGYLPEERGLYRTMRVGEYLSYIGRLKGAPRADLGRRVKSWLERIELPDVEHRRDVRVVQPRRQARLVEEHRHEGRIARVLGQDPLEHHARRAGRCAPRPRQVQLGHSSGRQVTHQLEGFRNNRHDASSYQRARSLALISR